jgi:hypothetical protein
MLKINYFLIRIFHQDLKNLKIMFNLIRHQNQLFQYFYSQILNIHLINLIFIFHRQLNESIN